MKNFLKYTKEPITRALFCLLIFALLFSSNVSSSYESLLNQASSPQEATFISTVETKQQAINSCKNSELDSEFFSTRLKDGLKHKKFLCFISHILIAFRFIKLFRSFSYPEELLSKPFTSLEILSSRNHPPTFI